MGSISSDWGSSCEIRECVAFREQTNEVRKGRPRKSGDPEYHHREIWGWQNGGASGQGIEKKVLVTMWVQSGDNLRGGVEF